MILLVVVGGGAYIGTQKNNTVPAKISTPSPAIQQVAKVVASPTINPTPIDSQSDWKLYSGNGYSFSYPVEWNLTGGPSEYLESVQLLNPNKTVSITFSKGQYPYGFNGQMDSKTNKISINIDGKIVEATETILNNKGAYVDFAIGENNILYGTDYPAVGTEKASLDDYNSTKETIMKILSSFKSAK